MYATCLLSISHIQYGIVKDQLHVLEYLWQRRSDTNVGAVVENKAEKSIRGIYTRRPCSSKRTNRVRAL